LPARRATGWRAAAVAGWAGACALVCSTSPAHAQAGPRAPASLNGDGADTHLFRPAVDSKGFFSVNGSRILGANDVSFGLVLDYGRNLLRVRDEARDPADGVACTDDVNCVGVRALVPDSFQGTFSFNYGIANKAVVGLSLPVVLASGSPAFNIGPDPGTLYDSVALDSQGLSWVALHAKLRLTRIEETLGLALLLQGGLPVGARAHNLASEPGAWFWPQAVADYQFGATGRFKVGANAGFRWHSQGSDTQFAANQLESGQFRNGNLLTGQVGFAWRALDALDLVGETYATYLVDDFANSKQKFSQEYIGGIKLFIERNSYLMMGAGSRTYSTGFEAADLRLLLGFVFEPSIGDRDGDGYTDDQDECPDDPEDFDGFEDGDGCPDPDNDKDGILDVDDACPNDPEDKDGFEDEDGCPEPDNDLDGIPDVKDQCPNEPETYNGHEDEDGCPDKGKVIIEGDDILILEKINFATNSTDILPNSFPIIDAVATTLKHHPDFLVIEIAGHADERSSDEYNLNLTKGRAASVVQALVDRHIDSSRFVSQGYGEYCPLDEGHNETAWEQNRRVEFKVVKTEDGLTGVKRGCARALERGVTPPAVKE
jgi:outer membrane protein OmpA-like peptidoglycan-associated protein